MDDVVQHAGKGAHAVIALHGWFGSSEAWQPLLAHVDGAEFTYYLPDFRGYGARSTVPGEHTVAEAAGDVLALADRLGLDRFSLLGHSMGGSVMQRVLADAPGRVRALIGISPVPASGMPFDEQTGQLFASAPHSPEARRTIIDFTTGGRLAPERLDAMVEHSLRASDPEAFGAYLRAWAGTDFHTAIEGSEVPVRVIVGRHDPAITAALARDTFGRWYRDCVISEFADAGHYAAEETPEATATAVDGFLRDLP